MNYQETHITKFKVKSLILEYSDCKLKVWGCKIVLIHAYIDMILTYFLNFLLGSTQIKVPAKKERRAFQKDINELHPLIKNKENWKEKNEKR